MRRTAAEAAETRRRVVDAALLALAEHGYEGATFAGIAERIGMTRGAVHHHFPGGKPELLACVLSEQWSAYGERALAPLRAGLPAADALRRFLTGYLKLLHDDEMFRALATVTTLVAAQAGAPADGLAEHRRSLDHWRATIRSVVDGPGVLRPGVGVSTAVFVLANFVLGLNDIAALEPEQLPRTDTARRQVARAVLAGLLGDLEP